MNSPKPQTRLHAITVLFYLAVFAAIPALAAPATSPSPAKSPAATPAAAPAASPAVAAPAASPAASAAPVAKTHPFPFKNTVVAVDPAARTFRIGKKTVHQVHVLPETKVLKTDESPATFEEIVVGMEIQGSVNKRADGDYDAVSVKVGPKAEASPAANPSPAKAKPAK